MVMMGGEDGDDHDHDHDQKPNVSGILDGQESHLHARPKLEFPSLLS